MSSKPATDGEAKALQARFEARARAELAAADAQCPGSDAVAWRGALLAGIVLVKGMPGPAEAAGGAALSGADGEAAFKALDALGWQADEVFCTLSRPVPGCDELRYAGRLRLQIEAVDPLVVVALDEKAAQDLGRAFDLPPVMAGSAASGMGRRLVAVGDLEASLLDERLKRRVWKEFQAAKPPGAVY